MEDRLEKETSLNMSVSAQAEASDEELAKRAEETSGLLDFSEDENGSLPPEVSELIRRCLDGTEPAEGKKPWHQDKFSARHVNVCMLRAAGFKNGEIASAMGANPATISWTLSHPYGKKIIHAL